MIELLNLPAFTDLERSETERFEAIKKCAMILDKYDDDSYDHWRVLSKSMDDVRLEVSTTKIVSEDMIMSARSMLEGTKKKTRGRKKKT